MIKSSGDNAAAPSGAKKFLTFFLGKEEYGVEIVSVQGIIGVQPVVPVPGTPAYMKGVINLRGKITPVMDLRARLGLPTVETSPETCIILLKEKEKDTGIIIDRVSEVSNIADKNVEPAPSFGNGPAPECVSGLARHGEKVIILLDTARLLAS